MIKDEEAPSLHYGMNQCQVTKVEILCLLFKRLAITCHYSGEDPSVFDFLIFFSCLQMPHIRYKYIEFILLP